MSRTAHVRRVKPDTPPSKGWRSGWCNRSHPPPHPKCDGHHGDTPCVCDCHTAAQFAAGLYDDVPEADYHSGAFGPDEGSLSHSGIKALLKAPAIYRHELDHPKHKRVWDLGTAAHKEVLGIGERLEVVLVTAKDGTRTEAENYMTNSAKAHRKEIREAGAVPALRSELEQVQAMAAKLREHPDAAKLLRKGRPEVSAYAVDDDTGVWRRCRFDYLRDEIAIDYKSAANASPWTFAKAAYDNGYYIQAPFYLQLARDLDVDLGDFAFIVQEKDPPYLVGVYLLDDDAMELGRLHAAKALQLFKECRETDTWPGYSTPGNTLTLPRYAYMEESA